jgi:hypothetical protein
MIVCEVRLAFQQGLTGVVVGPVVAVARIAFTPGGARKKTKGRKRNGASL